MDTEIHRQRHAQRWEAAESSARKIAIGGVIFAVLILLNVVEPYFEIDEQKKLLPDLQSELQSLQNQKQALEARRASLTEIKVALDNVDKAVASAPWKAEIEKLIEICKRNCSLQKANETVENIASLMRQQTVAPLRRAISQTGMASELESAAARIDASIDAWREPLIDNPGWFQSVELKHRTAAGVGSGISDATREAAEEVDAVSAAATQELAALNQALEAQKQSLETEKDTLDKEISEKQSRIEQAMQAALPAWATGLFTVERMVNLYPWILLIVGIWVVVNGLTAGHHYRRMADAEGWTAEERGDPVLSTPWTLTWRGAAGGAVTIMSYGATLGVLIYCIYRSANPGQVDAFMAKAEAQIVSDQPVELAMAVLALALVTVSVITMRRGK